MLGVASTQPDIDVDQILNSLDADTRNYLLLLLAGGAQAVPRTRQPGRGAERRTAVADLRGTFKRFAPLNRDTRTSRACWRSAATTSATRSTTSSWSHLARRRRRQLTSLINASNTNFTAISSQDAALEQR